MKERLADLIPDVELRDRTFAHLYSRKPLLSEGSVFGELLQAMVNKMLEGGEGFPGRGARAAKTSGTDIHPSR